MHRGPATLPPEDRVEPLDIDLDTLDHALMDLLTSDWQPLDDAGPPDADPLAQPWQATTRGPAT